MDNLLNFVDIVNEYIAAEGITINQFAKRIDVAESAVYKWLSMDYFPSLSCVVKVADLFNCSIDYLMGLKVDKTFIRGQTNNTFINRFESMLKKSKVTQYRVSKECKVGEPAISKWKRGKVPKVETIISLAKYFNCSIDYLIARSDIN